MIKKTSWALAGSFVLILFSMFVISLVPPVSAAPNYQGDPTPTPQHYLGEEHSGPLDNTFDWWYYGSACWTTQDEQVALLIKRTSSNGSMMGCTDDPNGCSAPTCSSTGSSTIIGSTWACFYKDFGSGSEACDYACDEVGGCNSIKSLSVVAKSSGVQTKLTIKTHPDLDHSGEVIVKPIYYGVPPECEQPDPMDLPPLESSRLSGTDIIGHHFDLTEGKDYYLVLDDAEAWNDGSDDRYDAAVSWDGGETWEQVAAGNGPLEDPCNAEPGPNETAVMFTADADHLSMDLRVNDGPDDLDFADNDGYLQYKLSVDDFKSGETGCGVNYSTGDLIVNYSEDPSSSFSSNIIFDNQDIYRFVVPHSWVDGSQYQTALSIQNSNGGGWVNMDDYPNVVCVEDHDLDKSTEDGWMTYYLRSPKDQTWYNFAAEDLNLNYGDNSGSMDIDVYSAAYDPGSSPCAAQYDVINTIEGIIVFATQENGYEIPNALDNPNTPDIKEGLIIGQHYMFEEPTSWDGWYDAAGVAKFEWQISTDRVSWYDIDTWADCGEQTDLDHHNWYFQADAETYYIRVKDTAGNFSNNSGSLKLNLKSTTKLTSEPDTPEGSCPNYSLGDTIVTGDVSATQNEGYIPDVIEAGNLVALQLDPPAWSEGGISQKTADLRTTKTSFEDLANWSGALCTEYDAEGYPRIYMMSLDEQYLLRADASPGDNTGNVNYTVIQASWDEAPSSGNCETSYNPYTYADYPPDNPVIPATKKDGVLIKSYKMRSGTYKITTSGGPWIDKLNMGGQEANYDLEISIHNGADNSWVDLSEFADCYVPILDGEGNQVAARAYITIPESNQHFVRLRVDNEDSLWIDNSGEMQFSMMYDTYSADEDEDPYIDPYGDPDQPFQTGGCDLKCVTPSGISVPAWLEYFRCQLIKRMSFCNYHWAVIRHMRQLFVMREPFGSINEFAQAMGLVRQRVDSYAWAESGGEAPKVEAPNNFIFALEGGGAEIPLIGSDTPWGSGDIDILGEGATFSTECNNNMAGALGERLGSAICFGFNVLDSLGLKSWFQLIWDLVMLISLGMYFQNRWISKMQG